MIKKHQKWTTLIVTCTFIWMLQVSNLPLVATGTSEQISTVHTEQGPRFIEEDGNSGTKAKKKSILPWILIGVGVLGATAAVLFLLVLKSNYDITGSWLYFWKDTGDANWHGSNQSLIFSGNKKSGTLVYLSEYPGTYAVDEKNVTFNFNYGVPHTGTFITKDKMSGTFNNTTGTWEAVRAGAPSQVALLPASTEIPGKITNK